MFKYKRIMVIGCSASGKSTFARRLGKITGLPVTHLDNLFWKSGWIEEDREVFLRKQQAAIDTERWIIDGHYKSTMEMRLERADLIFMYDISRFARITGYLRRLISNWGKSRPDITAGCNEKLDFEFIKYIWNFDKTQLTPALEIISNYPDVKLITFHSRRQADLFLKKLEDRCISFKA